METEIFANKKKCLANDVLLCSVADVRWWLEEFTASTGVHIKLKQTTKPLKTFLIKRCFFTNYSFKDQQLKI